MRPIRTFHHLMSSRILVAPRTGTDGYGKPSYGTPVPYQAHLSRQPRLVRTALGQQVQSDQTVYLGSADPIQPTAQVTLSTGDVGSTEATLLHPVILSVERRFDSDEPHHTVLRLG